MNGSKVKHFCKQLDERTLTFDAYTVRDLQFTTEEALEIFDFLRPKFLAKNNNEILKNIQAVIFLLNMNYFGVTGEVFKNHLKTKYGK